MKGITIIFLLGMLSCSFGQSVSKQQDEIGLWQLEIALNVFVTEGIFEIKGDAIVYLNSESPLEKEIFEKSKYKLTNANQRPKDYKLPYVVFKLDVESTNEIKPLKFDAYQFGYKHFGSIYFIVFNQKIIFDRIDYVSSND